MARRPSRQRVYDHRLRKLVWETGNSDLFPELAIPRSTLAGWLREPPPDVVTVDWLGHSEVTLLCRLHKTEKRNAVLLALLRLLLTLVRVHGCHLDGRRLPDGSAKAKVLAAIESARRALPVAAILAVLHLSPARYHAWRRAEVRCELTDRSSCPRTSPTQLTAKEIETIREMVTSSDYRHMSVSCLAVYAQREGRVFAAPSTWSKLTREREWLRPRQRVYPAKPKIGIRASGPNEVWHVDTTIIRLLDGTRLYLHGIIDNYSRRILSWRLKERFEPKVTTCELLREAAGELPPDAGPPTLMVDSGVENLNEEVDLLVADNLFRRVVAQIEARESNSMIESWWRTLKNGWLYLNQLDTFTAVHRLVEFYVGEHNEVMPHWAHRGLTPNEVHYGSGDGIRERLAEERSRTRQLRIEVNRGTSCDACTSEGQTDDGSKGNEERQLAA